MKLCIIVYFALIAIQDVIGDVSHLQSNQYLPTHQQEKGTSHDAGLVSHQTTAVQQQQQVPSRSFLFGNVEIIRSVPIASYTIRQIVPAQQAHNSNYAETSVYAQSQTQNTASANASYNYPTPIGGFQGAQPPTQQTYTSDVQTPAVQPKNAQQLNTNQQPVGAAQQAISSQQFAAPVFASTQAAPIPTYNPQQSYNTQQSSYNAYPVYPPTQSQTQKALSSYNYSGTQNSFQPTQSQTAPQSEVHPTQEQYVAQNDYDVAATGTGSSQPIDLQQPNYAQQPHSDAAVEQPIPIQQSITSVPTSAAASMAPPTHFTPRPVQEDNVITQQAVLTQSQPPTFSQTNASAFIPQTSIEYPTSVQQNRNDNESGQDTRSPQDSRAYLPPAPQTESTVPETEDQAQNQPIVPVSSQPAEQSSPNYQVGSVAASQTANLPENMPQQQTYIEPTYNQALGANNYAEQAYSSPAQATYSIPIKSQHNFLAAAQQSAYPAITSMTPPPERANQAYLPPVEQQSNSGPASAPTLATSQQSQLSPEPNQIYRPPTQTLSPPQSNVGSERSSVSVQQINGVPVQLPQSSSAPVRHTYLPSDFHQVVDNQQIPTSTFTGSQLGQAPLNQGFYPQAQSQVSVQQINGVPVQLPQSSSAPVSHTYLPSDFNQMAVNQQTPTSTFIGSQVGQAPLSAAPVNQAFSPQAQAQLSPQSYSAPAFPLGPAPKHGLNTVSPPAQQMYSLPVQPSRVYLPPFPPTASYSDPSVPSYAAPAPLATPPFYSVRNAQSASISQENYPPAGLQQIVPAKATVLEPQNNNFGSIALPETILQSSPRYHSNNSQQNQPTMYEASLSAPSIPQLPATTVRDNSQNYGTVYGSNGGYIY